MTRVEDYQRGRLMMSVMCRRCAAPRGQHRAARSSRTFVGIKEGVAGEMYDVVADAMTRVGKVHDAKHRHDEARWIFTAGNFAIISSSVWLHGKLDPRSLVGRVESASEVEFRLGVPFQWPTRRTDMLIAVRAYAHWVGKSRRFDRTMREGLLRIREAGMSWITTSGA